jgi:hypothetical protein
MDFSYEFDFGPDRMLARGAFGIPSEADLAVSLHEDCTVSAHGLSARLLYVNSTVMQRYAICL